MRYVGLKEFLALPQGTVYEEVRKCSTGDGMLLIKGETISDRDWVECPLSGTIMLMSEKHSEGMAGALHLWENPENSAPVYTDVWGRNGKYPEDGEVFFYVYETADILKIITMLGGALLMQGVDLAFNSEKEEVSQMQMTDAMVPTTQALRAAQWMVSAIKPGSRNAEMFEEPKSVHGPVTMGLKALNAQLGEPRGVISGCTPSIFPTEHPRAKTFGEEIQAVSEACRKDQALVEAKLLSPSIRKILDEKLPSRLTPEGFKELMRKLGLDPSGPDRGFLASLGEQTVVVDTDDIATVYEDAPRTSTLEGDTEKALNAATPANGSYELKNFCGWKHADINVECNEINIYADNTDNRCMRAEESYMFCSWERSTATDEVWTMAHHLANEKIIKDPSVPAFWILLHLANLQDGATVDLATTNYPLVNTYALRHDQRTKDIILEAPEGSDYSSVTVPFIGQDNLDRLEQSRRKEDVWSDRTIDKLETHSPKQGHNMTDFRETRSPQGSDGREILNTIRQIERAVDVSTSLVVEMTFTLKRWGDVTLAIPSGVNEWFSHLEVELRAVLVQDLNPEEQAEAFLRTIYEVTATDMPIITLTVKGTSIQLFQETVPFSGQPWSYGFIKDGESFRQKTLDALVKTILEIV